MKSYSAQGVWWGLGIWRRVQRAETGECRLRGEQGKESSVSACASVSVLSVSVFFDVVFSHQVDLQHSTSMMMKRIERKKERMTAKLCMAIP